VNFVLTGKKSGRLRQPHYQGILEMKRFAFAAVAALTIAVPSVGQAAVLINNGPVVDGAGLSILTAPATTLGFGAQVLNNNRVADNFTVGGSGWNVQSLDFYSYQTGAVGFTFTTATWSIVSGDVNTGSVVASGTTAVTNGGLLGYRVTNTTLTATNRAIYRLSADITDLVLAAGSYYLVWSMDGTAASGPWAPPVVGSLGTGNAYQSLAAAPFALAIDAGAQQGADVPFTINGTLVGGGAVPEPASWLMMLAGFGLVGAGMRRRQTSMLTAAA
jgi:PEP-CTERM motif